MWIPFFGWYIVKMRMIPVDRGSRSKALKAVVAATEAETGTQPPPADHLSRRHAARARRRAGLQIRHRRALRAARHAGRAGRACRRPLLAAAQIHALSRHDQGALPAADPARARQRRIHAAADPRDGSRLRRAFGRRRRVGKSAALPPTAIKRLRNSASRSDDAQDTALAASSSAISERLKLQRGSADQAVDLRQRGGAGDRRGDAGLRHDPGERHLGRAWRRARAATASSARKDREAARVQVACFTPPPRGLLPRSASRAVLAGEETRGQAEVGDDAEALRRGRGRAARPRIGAVVEVVVAAAASRSAAGPRSRRPRARRRAGRRRGSTRRSRGPCPRAISSSKASSVSS